MKIKEWIKRFWPVSIAAYNRRLDLIEKEIQEMIGQQNENIAQIEKLLINSVRPEIEAIKTENRIENEKLFHFGQEKAKILQETVLENNSRTYAEIESLIFGNREELEKLNDVYSSMKIDVEQTYERLDRNFVEGKKQVIGVLAEKMAAMDIKTNSLLAEAICENKNKLQGEFEKNIECLVGVISSVEKKLTLMLRENITESDNKFHTELERSVNYLISTLEEIRAENINLDKLIHEKLDSSKEELIRASQKRTTNRSNTDINKQIWALAGRETAEYVTKSMAKCITYPNPNVLREKAMSHVELEGLHLEFGVFSGKTINQLADLQPHQTYYGFDSFEGLPETWRTGFYEKKFATGGLPEVRANVQLIKGWFDETLPFFLEEHKEQCAFLHVDCDLYSSTKCIFELLKDRIVPGTIIVFDEYFNYPSWKEHEFKAFQEFVEENKVSYEYIGYVPNWEQVAVKITSVK